jgi:hypothetical protein
MSTYHSLENTCGNNGVLYTKGFVVGAWLASGNKMEDADPTVLQQYANEDAQASLDCAKSQFKRAYVTGGEKLIQLIIDQSNNIPALCSIELNGMQLDVEKAGKKLLSNDFLAGLKRHDCTDFITRLYPKYSKETIDKLNVTANRTVSSVLFGVPKEIELGKKKKDKEGIVFDKPLYKEPVDQKPNKSLCYSVTEETLRHYKDDYSRAIKDYRGIVKESNTYLSPLIDRANTTGGFVYTNIHTTSTNTGRTSSSDPNFQNMPDSIRELFFSGEGNLVEIDFKQLELCAIAELSGDTQLIQDITDGVDVHYMTGKRVFGWKSTAEMDSASRRNVKGVVFGLCYGGGPNTLSKQIGVDIDIVRSVINAFYTRYPGVEMWHQATLEEAEKNAGYSIDCHPCGTVKKETYIQIEQTGRFFNLYDSPSPEWMRKTKPYSFPTTKLKNYRAQGFAGGDIVLNYVKVLFHFLDGHTSTIRLRNMIHDSVVASVPKDDMELFNKSVAQAKEYIEQYLELKVPLTIEVKSSGNYWK